MLSLLSALDTCSREFAQRSVLALVWVISWCLGAEFAAYDGPPIRIAARTAGASCLLHPGSSSGGTRVPWSLA